MEGTILAVGISEIDGNNEIEVCSVDDIGNKGISYNLAPFIDGDDSHYKSTLIDSLCEHPIIVGVDINDGYFVG